MFKFERLEVWRLSLDYADTMYALAEGLPDREARNLGEQMIRAATSVSLNIAEGSTGQSDAEQIRFLGMALRSLIETVACERLMRRRGYLKGTALSGQAGDQAALLARKLQAMRRALRTVPEPSPMARKTTEGRPLSPSPLHRP